MYGITVHLSRPFWAPFLIGAENWRLQRHWHRRQALSEARLRGFALLLDETIDVRVRPALGDNFGTCEFARLAIQGAALAAWLFGS